MAGPLKYTHEEIMRRYNFTALRVASWQTSPSYSLQQAAGQQGAALRQTPQQMYRYVIPSENVPEPTDDEESDSEVSQAEAEAEVSSDIQPGDDILIGILKNTTPAVPESMPTPVVVEEASESASALPANIQPKDESKPRSKGRLRSAWSKPITKAKAKPSKSTGIKAETLSIPAAVVVPPEAPSPPLQPECVVDHVAASREISFETSQDTAYIPADDEADNQVPSDQTEQPAEVCPGTTTEEIPAVSQDEPKESQESTLVAEQDESATTDAADAAETNAGDPTSNDVAPEEPFAAADAHADADNNAEEPPSNDLTPEELLAAAEPHADSDNTTDEVAADGRAVAADAIVLVDPPTDILAKLDEIPVSVAPLDSAADEESSSPPAADAEKKLDPLALLLEELMVPKVDQTAAAKAEPANSMDDVLTSTNEPETTFADSPKGTDEASSIVEDIPKSIDESESIAVTADDASVVASIESEDKHVSFAPGTPEPKPTKRKKRATKDKNKRRPSVTKSDAPKPEIEVSALSMVAETAAEAPAVIPGQDTLDAVDDPEPDSKVAGETASDVKASPVTKKTATRPRSSSKSAGMFATGGLLGFTAKAKSSKGKDKKKKGIEEEAKPDSDTSEAAAIGLGIISAPGAVETAKPEEPIEALADVSETVEAVKKDEAIEVPAGVLALQAVQEDEAVAAVAEVPVVETTQEEGAMEAQANVPVFATAQEDAAIEDSQPVSTSVTDAGPDVASQEEVSHIANEDATFQSTMEDTETAEDKLDPEDNSQESSETSNDEVTTAESKTGAAGVIEVDPSAIQQEHIPTAEALTHPSTVVSLPAESNLEVIEKVIRQDSGFEEPAELYEPDGHLESEQPSEQTLVADIKGVDDAVGNTHIAIVPQDDTIAEKILDVDDPKVQTQEEPAITLYSETTMDGSEESCTTIDDVIPTDQELAIADDVATSDDVHASTEVADSIAEAVSQDDSSSTTEQAAAEAATPLDIASSEEVDAAQEIDHPATIDDVLVTHDASLVVAPAEHGDERAMVADATSPDDDAAIKVDASAEVEHAIEALVDAGTDKPVSLQQQNDSGEEPAAVACESSSVAESQTIVNDQAPIDIADTPKKSGPETSVGEPNDAVTDESSIAAESRQAGGKEVSTSGPAEAETTEIPAEEPETVTVRSSLESQPGAVAVEPAADPQIETDLLPSMAELENNSDNQPFVTAIAELPPVDTNPEPDGQDLEAAKPIVTEILEPASVNVNMEPTFQQPDGAEPFVPGIVVPAVIAATIKDSASSPNASRSRHRRTSERSNRPKTSRRRIGEPSSIEKDPPRTADRGHRSSEHRTSVGDASRKHRRDASKIATAHDPAEDRRQAAEEEEHRRRRREARRAERKVQEAEDAARLTREQAEATAHREAEARRRLRHQAATDRSKTKDSGAARPKLANLPFASTFSTGSSVSKAGLLVRTRDEYPRESRDSGKRASREDVLKRRGRRDSTTARVVLPVDARPAQKHGGNPDRGSTHSRPDAGSTRESVSNVDPPSRSSEGERRRRSERSEGDHSQRRRRASERSDKRSPTETKKSGFLSSLFKSSR